MAAESRNSTMKINIVDAGAADAEAAEAGAAEAGGAEAGGAEAGADRHENVWLRLHEEMVEEDTPAIFTGCLGKYSV